VSNNRLPAIVILPGEELETLAIELHCVNAEVQELEFVIKRVICGASVSFITPKPSRQPVIEYDLLKPSRMMVRSCMPGNWVML
jgi:hypothetical protein